MFAQAIHLATAPLRFVNADIPTRDYVDARASRVSRERQIERLIWRPTRRSQVGYGRSMRPTAKAAVRRMRRAPPERAVCRGDEE